MARPTLIQGGPAFFTPEGYVPPVQPEQAFMPTDVMRDPIADMFAAQPPLTRGPSLPKMINPPKRPDQIFIDDMPPMREEPPMNFPMPMPEPMPPVPFGGPEDLARQKQLREAMIAAGDDPDQKLYAFGGGNGLEKMPVPPKRDDFMSIGGPGGGYTPGTSELMDRMFLSGKTAFDDSTSIGGPGGGFDYDSITAIGAGGGPEFRNMNQNSFLGMGLLRNAAGNPADAFRTPPSVGDGMTSPGLMPTKPDMLPNLATGVMEPVGQPMPQLPQGPQPIPQVPSPIMPPMREVPPEDFGFGPGIRRSEDFFRGEDLIMPPMAPPKPLGEDVPPMPMENIIRANDPAIMPMPSKMPMLPEPMPMPMPMRPRMPMPGPIATPMPMAPTNLQLPQIETQMPMMSLDRGIGSFKTLV